MAHHKSLTQFSIACIAAMSSLQAFANPFSDGGQVNIFSESTHLLMDSSTLASHPGAAVIMEQENYQNRQVWDLVPTTYGTQIVNSQGFCLGLPPWATTRPTLVNCETSEYSHWQSIDRGNGQYALQNTATIPVWTIPPGVLMG